MYNIQKKFYDFSNPYFKFWKDVDENSLPNRMNKIIEIDYSEFIKNYVRNENNAKELVKSLLDGDFYILKNTLSKNFIDNVKEYVGKKFKHEKSEFHKVKDGVPNFTRYITSKLGKKYSFNQCKLTRYFFPFNEHSEELKIYDTIYPIWRKLKFISGYHNDVWENNIPSDGIVDRLQITKYPPGEGQMEMHQDPYLFQRFFISLYLSKRGNDYDKGGIYVIDKNNQKIDIEKNVTTGDLSFGMATIMHGVDKCEVFDTKKSDDMMSGRWWMGLYTMQTDVVKNRHTGKPVPQEIQNLINSN